jgi:hypothetical protein
MDVADARGELEAGEVEDRECGQSLPGGVGGVLGDRQVGRVAEVVVEHGSRRASAATRCETRSIVPEREERVEHDPIHAVVLPVTRSDYHRLNSSLDTHPNLGNHPPA